jgi:hypothetical protein
MRCSCRNSKIFLFFALSLHSFITRYAPPAVHPGRQLGAKGFKRALVVDCYLELLSEVKEVLTEFYAVLFNLNVLRS